MASQSTSLDLAQARRRETGVYMVSAVVFTTAAGITWYFAKSMSGGMAMPGGWTMSMSWMPMDGWLASAVMFAGMWGAMMVAMMLPSTFPMILLYGRAARFRGETRTGLLSAVMATGYFGVWTLFGAVAYGAGVMIAQFAMHSAAVSRAVPFASGIALIIAGAYQLTPWKASCLEHCRDPLSLVATHVQSGWRGALRLGVHHGAFCAACCWALMLIQLAVGVMNVLGMIAIALVIALEKLLPKGLVVARATGVLAIAAGAAIAARAFF